MGKKGLISLFGAASVSLGISSLSAFANPSIHTAIDQCVNRIHATGNVQLLLRQYSGKGCYSIKRDNKKSALVKVKVRDRTLYISSNKKSAKITIAIKSLADIHTYNHASITSKQFNNHSEMNIEADNFSSIKLAGNFTINHITQKSIRPINVAWVKSHELSIDGYNSGRVTLSGSANHLYAKLHNNSQLNAEYLRAQNVTIKTNEYATAKVTAINLLSAFAHDNSNIYYYKQPKNITRVSTGAANILQLGWHK